MSASMSAGRARPSWRVDLHVPHHAFGAFADVLDPFVQAISVSEVAGPTGRPVWRIQGYADAEPDRGAIAAAAALAALAAAVPAPEPELVALGAVDWLAENRRSFPPQRAGRFYIHGAHVATPPPPGALALQVEAAIAFGSGEHGSTRGCLLALDGLARRMRVRRALDMGCGSGILSLAIALLWPAARIVAVDVDADSAGVAAENARLNRCASRIRVQAGDGYGAPAARAAAPYDLIAANILARPLQAMAPALARALRPGGIAVLSGLLAAQEPAVLAAHRVQGLSLVRRIASEGWHTLVLRRGR
jgi:ribosomal protein L11 methyltransferase